MDAFLSVVIGAISSLAASGLFLFCLFKLRPNIMISPYIAISKSSEGSNEYRFKIINKTSRPIINLRVRIFVSNRKNVPDGVMVHNKRIPLAIEDVFQMPRYDLNDKNADYARRFICKEDINSLWEDKNGCTLKIIVMATDSLSGFSKVFIKEYHTKKNTLVEGSHRFGDSLEIL